MEIDKVSYFKLALKSGASMNKEWVLSIFTRIVDGLPIANNTNHVEDESGKNGDDYDYRIYKVTDDPKSVYFLDPNNPGKLSKLHGVTFDAPIYQADEYIDLVAGDLPNITAPVHTRYFTAIINSCILCYPFGHKIPYIQKRMGSWLDDEVSSRVDLSPDASGDHSKLITVKELIKYHEALGYIRGFTQICTPSVTAKAIVPSREVRALRDRLLEENKSRLNDPAVVVDIMRQIAEADKKQLEGDPSAKFYTSSKAFNVTRMKALNFYGPEYGFGDSGSGPVVITRSLDERLPLSDLPVQFDTIRYGSYSRGIATAFGGAKVKYAARIFQNTRIVMENCGTKFGIKWKVRKDTAKQLENRYRINDKGAPELITKQFLDTNIGNHILVRTPQLCVAEAPYYCSSCLDKHLALRPDGLYLAPMDVNSIFMNMSMKAMHGKQRSVERLDLEAAFNY